MFRWSVHLREFLFFPCRYLFSNNENRCDRLLIRIKFVVLSFIFSTQRIFITSRCAIDKNTLPPMRVAQITFFSFVFHWKEFGCFIHQLFGRSFFFILIQKLFNKERREYMSNWRQHQNRSWIKKTVFDRFYGHKLLLIEQKEKGTKADRHKLDFGMRCE